MAWSAPRDDWRATPGRREEVMTDKELVSGDRRKLMKAAAAGAGAAALFGGFGFNPLVAQALAKEAGRSEKPLKAAFSNAGLQATWCPQAHQPPQHFANPSTLPPPSPHL